MNWQNSYMKEKRSLERIHGILNKPAEIPTQSTRAIKLSYIFPFSFDFLYNIF